MGLVAARPMTTTLPLGYIQIMILEGLSLKLDQGAWHLTCRVTDQVDWPHPWARPDPRAVREAAARLERRGLIQRAFTAGWYGPKYRRVQGMPDHRPTGRRHWVRLTPRPRQPLRLLLALPEYVVEPAAISAWS
jgi:hypothetical protein